MVKGAHICLVTHITMQELAVTLDNVQIVNGFGNRMLWLCVRRPKLVPMPQAMPENLLAPMQRELWRLINLAQQRNLLSLNSEALELWRAVYPELSQEGLALTGAITNRAEAQTLRLALIYALLDGQDHIAPAHLKSALAMWQYAAQSAQYIFGDRAIDPLEQKIVNILAAGPLNTTGLHKALSGHVSKEKLSSALRQLEIQRRISIDKQSSGGRPATIISLCERS